MVDPGGSYLVLKLELSTKYEENCLLKCDMVVRSVVMYLMIGQQATKLHDVISEKTIVMRCQCLTLQHLTD